MNYKSSISIFFFSTILLCSFNACNKKEEPEKKDDIVSEIQDDKVENKTAFILDYQKNGDDDFLIVDTIQIANNIDFINPIKDSTKLQLDKNAGIVFQTLSFDSTGNFNFNQKLDYPAFIKLIASKEIERFKTVPFEFEVKNGIIIFIKEIYIP